MKFLKILTFLLMVVLICSLVTACTACENDNPTHTITQTTAELSQSTDVTKLLITPAVADKDADVCDDVELISMLDKQLYPISSTAYDWIINVMVDIDFDNSLEDEKYKDYRYLLVTNLQNIDELKANLSAVFSESFLETYLYNYLFEAEYPLYIESDGQLYVYADVGGAQACLPDFTRADVSNKAKNSFDITVPITTVDDQVGVPFTYHIIKQNGYWVFDTYNLLTDLNR